MHRKLLIVGLAGASAIAATMSRSTPASATAAGRDGADAQGRRLNARSLNGTTLLGMAVDGNGLAGQAVEDAALDGVELFGSPVDGVTLNATVFSGTTEADAITGPGFVGSVWSGRLSDGSEVALRIDHATRLAAPNEDLHAYRVSYQTSEGWSPLCGTGGGLAIPIGGRWSYGRGVAGGGSWTADASRFTFACRASAIAKCVELGYKPWRVVGGTSLEEHLVACTRVLRGDYCGDGSSSTADGSAVSLHDDKGIRSDARPGTIEADWTGSGARFVSTATMERLSSAFGGAPRCLPAIVSTARAGDAANFATGTLIVTQVVE